MTRLQLVVLEQDERAVLTEWGQAGVLELSRIPAGSGSTLLPPRNRGAELARIERTLSRLENIQHSFPKMGASSPSPLEKMTLEQAETALRWLDEQTAPLFKRRQELQENLTKMVAEGERIADYRELALPLDQPNESSYLHFVTGSMPSKMLDQLKIGEDVALLPVTEHEDRQVLIAMTTRQKRVELDQALKQAGFKVESLPVAVGNTTSGLAEQNRQGQELAVKEIDEIEAKLHSVAEKSSIIRAQIETTINIEKQLLEAGQAFARTESSILITGWLPSADVPSVALAVQQITHGCYAVNITPAKDVSQEEIPVLLRHPRWLRPFAPLVTAYGLPHYHELEPTLFVAMSYLLMFGMMFGDIGHGSVLAATGLILRFSPRRAFLRNAGLLLVYGGISSMIFGALYGSCFGVESFKPHALWHDPLSGDPMSLLMGAMEIGCLLISLGLILNVINRFRRGDFAGALFDKFGVAGALFYWTALAMAAKSPTLRSHGLLIPAIWLMAGLALAWMLKAPVLVWLGRHGEEKGKPDGILSVFLESLVNCFEGVLSYFANTVSFVRLAAYAMSHAALLLSAFLIAADVRHLSIGGTFLGVLVIILGNVVAIVLEGIVASVQALRLEYYEFFGKFYPGGGRPFQPFRLQSNIMAEKPQ